MIDLAAETMLDAVPMPVLIVDTQERIVAGNRAARGVFADFAVGRPYVTLLRQPQLGAAVDSALREGQASSVRVVIAAPRRDMVAMVACSVLPEGLVMLVFEDITALEEAEAMRRDFVANVSHELRTPLTALMGFVETLRGAAKEDPVARERFLEIMEREAGRMNRLVGDLLSLSRVEAEERRRPTAKVDVVAVVKASIQTLRPLAEAAAVTLWLEAEAGPVLVPADADQLMQVFNNLIENAVKYGAAGGEVRVEVSRLPHEAMLRGPAVQVAVIDRGEGIEPLHLPRLTERFYRADSHRARAQGGTGLGLAIVKHIVARHRGRLRIESEKGQGSRFLVILPEA